MPGGFFQSVAPGVILAETPTAFASGLAAGCRCITPSESRRNGPWWTIPEDVSICRSPLVEPNDFDRPHAYSDRKQRTAGIEQVRRLWRSAFENGVGEPTRVRIYPQPRQEERI
jgi:hypothetical protein